MARQERPVDDSYYEQERIPLLSQGDIFRDVPLAYPSPAEQLLLDESEEVGVRAFLSGPLDFGPAMLITPTCSMRAQQAEGYSHPVRTLVPLLPLETFLEARVVKPDSIGLARKYDALINYMYLPPCEIEELDFSLPESFALLYMPVTLHHDFIDGNRMTQLAVDGARQLQRKLVWFDSGWLESRELFDPPMD